jgi:tetratricopeptide (TPR) repeat protein
MGTAQSEVTQAIPVGAPTMEMDADTLLADAARRRKIEQDLARMGMSPVEIRKLLDADANSADPLKQSQPQMPAAPVGMPSARGAVKNAPPSPESLSAFAAQLLTARAAEQARAVEQAAQALPEFRESSTQEVRQAEQLLRDAAMLRRREKYADAEKKCRDALLLTPKDAAALELLGDILQGVARVNEALAAYKRATEADPKRGSAEHKYGELLMQQQRWDTTDPEAVPKNARFALLLSLLFPGLGQFHNSETGKGIFFLLADVVCIYLLAFSPFGFVGEQGRHGINMGLVTCVILTLVVYLTAAYDASTVARNGGSKSRGHSGWDV